MSEDRSISGQKSWLEKITQAFAHEPKNRQELLEILREAHDNKLLDSEALAIVEGAIQVADLQVRDIMVPRSQVISIRADQSPREFLPAIIEAAHSRYPVVGESLDEVIGILLAKDLLPLVLQGEQQSFNIKDLLRPATFVPIVGSFINEFLPWQHLLTYLDAILRVYNRYGRRDNKFKARIKILVKALTPIDEFNDYFEVAFPDDEFDTVAGLVMNAFGHLPKRNEVIEIDGFRVRVLNADSRRVHMLRLSRLEREAH